MQIPLARPDITELEIEAGLDVLGSGRLSLGPRQEQFEQALADFVGCRHGVAVSSGTAALHLAMIGCGIGPGDQVITSPFSFVASANSALFVNATCKFVDIDPDTWNIDPELIDRAVTDRTKAILPVHVFGQCCRMDRIMQIADAHGLAVIEDACEALGAQFDTRPAGSFGRCSTFAFYPNKQITTAEGGMLVTNDQKIADLARSLRNQGRGAGGQWLVHQRLGYNYRLSELHAALGCVQMQRIDEILDRRRQTGQWYSQRLGQDDRIVLQKIHPQGQMSRFVFVIRLADRYQQAQRDRLVQMLNDQGIGTNIYFVPIHLQPFYRQQFGYTEGDFPICERIGQRCLALPFGSKLTEQQVEKVCCTLNELLEKL